jgi:biopolymer transport protein ExbB
MPEKELVEAIVFVVLGVMLFGTFFITVERSIFFKSLQIEQYEKRQELEIDLTRYMSLMATIGSSAPYVGLLGTVFGIIITFYQIGQGGGMLDAGAIMTGLALALWATAAGLFVAIPTTVIYNLLNRRIDVFLARWDALHA